jgi:hypothetical protein
VRAGLLRHSHDNAGSFTAEPFTSVLDLRQPEYGLRHTFDVGRHRVAWGYEATERDLTNPFTTFPFEDASITTNLDFDERSRNAYLSGSADVGPLRVEADAWWQDSHRTLNATTSGMLGGSFIPGPTSLEDRSLEKVTPRVGARYLLDDHISVRAAYQDWVRPMGTSTLGPVATAGIPMDDRLVARGGRQRRARGQFEWEGERTYGTLYYDWKEMDNLRFSYEPFFITEDENLYKLRNFDYGQLAAEDLYEFISPPSFDGARITIAGAASIASSRGRFAAPALRVHRVSQHRRDPPRKSHPLPALACLLAQLHLHGADACLRDIPGRLPHRALHRRGQPRSVEPRVGRGGGRVLGIAREALPLALQPGQLAARGKGHALHARGCGELLSP